MPAPTPIRPTLPLSVADRAALEKLGVLLDSLRVVSPYITLAQVATLLTVARNQGAGVSEVAEGAGLRLSVASRNLEILGDGSRLPGRSSEGLGLVQVDYAPLSKRSKVVTLTQKGSALVRTLIHQISS